MSVWIPALSGLGGAVIAGVFGLILLLLQRPRMNAETTKLEAEASKLEAEAQNITSESLYRELNRLVAQNTQQAALLVQQADDLETLRKMIRAYEIKESQHAIENASLKQRIEELTAPTSTVGVTLRQAFAPEIGHRPNEND